MTDYEAIDGTPFSSNTSKERFSLAYIQAVAARAGYDVLEPKVDIDSVDGLLRSTVGRRPQIDFQAKATSRSVLQSSHVAYPLKLKIYEDLRVETVNPRILIIVLLPDDESEWMTHSEDELIMRRCGYWVSLRGEAAVQNTYQVTVKLPRTQLFDVAQLRDLMARAEIGPVL